MVECNFKEDKYTRIMPLMLGSEVCVKGHSYGPAVRMYYLIHYCLSGKGKYCVNGHEYSVCAGEAFVIKPQEITKYSADREDPWEYIWLGFSTELQCFQKLPYVIKDDSFKAIMEGIHKNKSYKTNNNICAFSESWQIISYLLDTVLKSENISYPSVAMNMIKARYMNKLTVKSIADELGLDRSYLTDIFKHEYGISPQQYIIAYRMERALELLKYEQYSISVVAASVGYNDLFVFSRAFKNHFGVPPKEFKKINYEFSAGTGQNN